MKTPDQSYTFKQVSEILGTSINTLYRMMNRGELNTFTVGSSRKVTESEISRIQNPEEV